MYLDISLIPIDGGQWFALKNGNEGFKFPAEFITYLSTGNFVDVGAAVTESALLSICLAAMKYVEGQLAKETLSRKENQTH